MESTQALPPGTRLEEFVIERVLGSGGFGITYLARDVSLSRQVVIKENLPAQFSWRDPASGTVRPRATSGGEADDFLWSMQNFLREADTLASLDHPGIVRVLRKFEANGTAYFVMPFVDGVALDELIEERHKENEWFTEIELTGMLSRLLAALDYLHARGIYHRDIKPGNILITSEGIPMLIDFGSARQRLSERSMTVVESAGYTPFEQLQSRGEIGPWSDLYALGATLVKAITGTAPPKAADRVMGDPWQGMSRDTQWMKVYSASFLQSIDKVLSVKPAQRWQSGSEWLLRMNANPSTPHPTDDAAGPATNLSPLTPPLTGMDDSPHPSPDQSEPTHAPVTFRPKPVRKVSKGTRQTLIAGAFGLVVIGLALLAIKKSGGNQKPAQTEIPKAAVVPVSAAEVEPSEWRKMAEAGDPFAQALLGDALFWGGMRGKGIEQDRDEGKKWIHASAEAAHPLGLFMRGLSRESGDKEAIEKDYAAAVEKGLLRDVEQGGPAWWTSVAVYMLQDSKNAENLKKAFEWLSRAAATGYIDPMGQLAECYRRGLGVEKDPAMAVHWYGKAAEAGSSEGMTQLALCYMSGIGTAKNPTESVRWLQKAADLGESEAQVCLGDAYSGGEGVTKDLKQAAHWYQKAADQGDAEGQFQLGMAYEDGEGVPEDPKEAVKWYRLAAEQGETYAQDSLGDCYAEGVGVSKDPAEAVLWYRKAAESGNALAQYSLASCYGSGVGVEKDQIEEVKWYRKAAEQGNFMAQTNLGVCLANGSGLEKNEIEAAKWYRKAADDGYDLAQVLLGSCYATGRGVDQDKAQAVRWFRKAADQGLAEAQNRLAICHYQGEGVPKNSTEAVKWSRLAADQNHMQAQYYLGGLYANGEGVARDQVEAAKWYQKAAEQGHAGAQFELGTCYSYGNGIAQDLIESVKWYRKAAEQGDSHAQVNLGFCYSEGNGVLKSQVEANRWWKLAAEQGQARAQNCIGYSYEMGNGIVKNEYEAVKWYHKAAVQGDEYAQTNLGSCYYDGRGVAKNLAIGYMWTNLAAESGEVQANKNLKKFTLEMTPALIAEGQRLSREWNAKHQDPFAAP